MFDRIKDFIYDISDIFVSLLIIAIIFVSVSWKISDTLSVDLESEPSGPPPIVAEPVDENENDETDTPTETVPPVEEETPTGTEESTPETTPTEETTTPTQPEPEKPLVLETFVVPDGAMGHDIGVELQNAGFITNVNDFVKRAIELGLDSKLRSGSFKLSKDDDLDTIIRILTGERRSE